MERSTRDCPEPTNVPSFTKASKIYVCFYAFITNSPPQWIVDRRATKHIVQDKTDFVDFHLYLVGS